MQAFPVIVTLELTVGMPAEGTRLLLLSSDPPGSKSILKNPAWLWPLFARLSVI